MHTCTRIYIYVCDAAELPVQRQRRPRRGEVNGVGPWARTDVPTDGMAQGAELGVSLQAAHVCVNDFALTRAKVFSPGCGRAVGDASESAYRSL